MIETYEDLKDWFYNLKLPDHTNTQALEMWDRALKSPTVINLRMFWVFGGMTRSFPNVAWEAIRHEERLLTK
jgi:hypothetical protein